MHCTIVYMYLGEESHGKEALSDFEVLLDTAIKKQLLPLQSYKLQSVRNQKLWSIHHKFSLGEGLNLCKACNESLKLGAHDIFWQIVIEEKMISSYKSGASAAVHGSDACPTSTSSRVLTKLEKNAIQYTAGAVVRNLTRKYTKNSSHKKAETYLSILKKMQSKLSRAQSSNSEESNEWTGLVDRGGLVHVTSTVYDLFMYLELVVDDELTSIFKSKGKGIERIRKERLNWVCDSEELQLVWGMIDEEDEDDDLEFLKEIASVWITIRGYSKTRKIKEDYKKAKRNSTKKRSLRKELKKENARTENNS